MTLQRLSDGDSVGGDGELNVVAWREVIVDSEPWDESSHDVELVKIAIDDKFDRFTDFMPQCPWTHPYAFRGGKKCCSSVMINTTEGRYIICRDTVKIHSDVRYSSLSFIYLSRGWMGDRRF